MVQDIDTGEDAPEGGDEVLASAASEAAISSGAFTCVSCGGTTVGPFCAWCGQKNDDLRRSSVVLAKDFMKDTFGFDSRMWRTLGLMALAPGVVPANYAHGRRSRYTPPVRLFLVVSFLFFLALALTKTMFVAVEVTKKTEAEIAAARAEAALAVEELRERGLDAHVPEDTLVQVEGSKLDCDINVRLRYFVRDKDLILDKDAWRKCADSLNAVASAEIKKSDDVASPEDQAGQEWALTFMTRTFSGLSAAVEDPLAFNREVNDWLPRVMFFMTPVLALLLTLFIRGRDALIFDHIVLSLYSHAVGFALIGGAILAAQAGAVNAGAIALVALGIYFVLALKRAYKRGWIKTLFTAVVVGLFYFAILGSAVMALVSNAVWRVA